jgi:hypothetical protein
MPSTIPGAFTTVTMLTVAAGPPTPEDTLRVYLRLDGKPAGAVPTPGGLSKRPLTFSWYVGDEFKQDKSKVMFRYQLLPEDDDAWGAWSRAQEVNYFFLPKGVHQFEVQAKYVAGPKVTESAIASFQFTIQKDLVELPRRR